MENPEETEQKTLSPSTIIHTLSTCAITLSPYSFRNLNDTGGCAKEEVGRKLRESWQKA